jgi:hypothetical protein
MTRTRQCRRRRLAALGVVALGWQALAFAQAPPAPAVQRWALEVHGGGLLGQTAGAGRAGEFPVGAMFTTRNDAPSRRVPSWYFGDGAALFNEVQQQFATKFGVDLAAIAALDPMLTSSSARRQTGLTAGVRLTRRLSPRFAIEIGVEHARAPLRLTSEARDAVEASRESFETALTELLSTAPILGLTVGSRAEIDDRGGHQTSVTGALAIDLVRRGRVGAYVVGGGGLVTNGGGESVVRLRGDYQFRLFGVFPFNEADNVTIRFVDRRRGAVAVASGGVTYDLGARQAVRVDVRAHAGPGAVRTLVTTTPAVARNPASEVLPSETTPSVQFSALDGEPSSLTPGAPELQTFTGGGLQVRMQLTVGFVLRF